MAAWATSSGMQAARTCPVLRWVHDSTRPNPPLPISGPISYFSWKFFSYPHIITAPGSDLSTSQISSLGIAPTLRYFGFIVHKRQVNQVFKMSLTTRLLFCVCVSRHPGVLCARRGYSASRALAAESAQGRGIRMYAYRRTSCMELTHAAT